MRVILFSFQGLNSPIRIERRASDIRIDLIISGLLGRLATPPAVWSGRPFARHRTNTSMMQSLMCQSAEGSGESMDKQWFALFVRTRWESSTESVLRNKGFETFLPTYNPKSLRNVRAKGSSQVLFPGYVFCRFDIHNRLPILVTPGVISVVGRGRTPVALEDTEIASIHTVASSGLPLEPWPYLEVGEVVRIQNHALAGLEGILLRFRGTDRVVVSVPLLRRSVAVEIDRSEVSSVRPERYAPSGFFPSPVLVGCE